MHIEEDEQVGRAIALVLAVVALELARLGRDWLANLADQLDRALVEADHRALGIGLFGIEVEHILHAGDILAIDLRNAPHVLAPRLEVVLGQPPAYRLPGDVGVLGELDQLTRQKLQGPAGTAFGRARTSRRHQQSLLFAGELALCSGARLLAERRLQVAEHEAALGPVDGRAAHADAPRDLIVTGTGIGGQENLRSLELARGVLSAAQKRGEFSPPGLAQFDPIDGVIGRRLVDS